MSVNHYFHGTNGDNLLSIIATGLLRPNQENEIYLSRFRWESCLMHGADRKRKASFVIEIRAEIPNEIKHVFKETHGVPDTVMLQSADPIPVTVLELFVRRLGEAGAQVERLKGATAIKRYLGG